MEIDLELGLAAHHRLKIAVQKGKPGTERLYTTAHIDQKLGPASDPEAGRTMLENLSGQGDLKASRDLLLRINWKRLDGHAPDHAVRQVVNTGLLGDARFAEPALMYLSRQGGSSRDVIATRAKLVNILGIKDCIRAPELVRLTAIQHPRTFWTQVETVLAKSSGDGFVQAASTAFRINKNA